MRADRLVDSPAPTIAVDSAGEYLVGLECRRGNGRLGVDAGGPARAGGAGRRSGVLVALPQPRAEYPVEGRPGQQLGSFNDRGPAVDNAAEDLNPRCSHPQCGSTEVKGGVHLWILTCPQREEKQLVLCM